MKRSIPAAVGAILALAAATAHADVVRDPAHRLSRIDLLGARDQSATPPPPAVLADRHRLADLSGAELVVPELDAIGIASAHGSMQLEAQQVVPDAKTVDYSSSQILDRISLSDPEMASLLTEKSPVRRPFLDRIGPAGSEE